MQKSHLVEQVSIRASWLARLALLLWAKDSKSSSGGGGYFTTQSRFFKAPHDFKTIVLFHQFY
jgi:hypothetical protein